MELRHCFKTQPTALGDIDGFSDWLVKSNNSKVGQLVLDNDVFNSNKLAQVEKESLKEILDILLREPLADYFWYSNSDGKLTYSLPHHIFHKMEQRTLSAAYEIVPDGLRVDKEKIRFFLRDIKIESLLKI